MHRTPAASVICSRRFQSVRNSPIAGGKPVTGRPAGSAYMIAASAGTDTSTTAHSAARHPQK
ncbi:Uncharacterised protein [Mycobacteroides abscessus subsp. abscessus]|nr:Uncharacterised protein [Mycobacteroides abscessus subsp. abscessus]